MRVALRSVHWPSLQEALIAAGAFVALGTPAAVSQDKKQGIEDVRTEIAIAVQHSLRDNGIRDSTSDNFCLQSFLDEQQATMVARKLEQMRADAHKKWIGTAPDKWTSPCDVLYFADANHYSRHTGASSNSPGRSKAESEPKTGRIVQRTIYVHGEVEHLLSTAFPHEVTHMVLAGQFAPHHTPRWLDEGAAVLAEKGIAKIHKKNLPKFREHALLFTAKELIALDDYPLPKRIGPFYAQSIALTEHLAAQKKGPKGVMDFARDCLRGDPDAAVMKHYDKTLDALNTELWEIVEREAKARPKAVTLPGMKK